MKHPKKIIVSVTNDLTSDQRVHKVCISLQNRGYQIQLVGRRLPKSLPLNRTYKVRRFRLLFNSGFLFYANYNIRLFLHLLFNKVDILLANDLDTLPANHLAARVKKLPIVYDSHEYFTQVPELINRPRIRQIWENVEQIILPRIKYAYTVSPRIARQYQLTYGVDFKLVRNFPVLKNNAASEEKKEEKIILYQGALNVGRGIEELIKAMPFVNNAVLWIAGGGDIETKLHRVSKELNLGDKVKFLGRLPFESLKEVTTKASLGVSIEKKEGLNYEYALPNKVFDYLHAEVPVLYSNLEVVVETLKGYEVGEVLRSYVEKDFAAQLEAMLESDKYAHWVKECRRAKQELNWEQEEQRLFGIFDALEQD